MSSRRAEPPAECAQCGSAIPRGAHACPGCGADERTGWREQSIYDGLELPDEAFEDPASPPRNSAPRPAQVGGLAWYWWVVAVALILLLGLAVLGLR